MSDFLDKFPNWIRWVLLVPLSMILGWLVSLFILYSTTRGAATEDAPAMYFGWLTSSLGGHLSLYYFAFLIAPSFRKQVVFCLMAITILSALFTGYEAIQYKMVESGLIALGQLLAAGFAWRCLTSKTETLRLLPSPDRDSSAN